VFERFVANFRLSPDGQGPGEPWLDPRLSSAAGYSEFAERFAGCTFENGLYRFSDATSGPHSAMWFADVFPEFAERACPFGYDWLGRLFALDTARVDQGETLVLIAEPGTGEVLEVPWSFCGFHESLDDLREPALAASFFDAWAQGNPDFLPIEYGECAGYRVPLFLGGKDNMENLELIDMDVYWSFCGQLRQGTLELPEGTSIRQVSVEP
jgi:hypothetical protein